MICITIEGPQGSGKTLIGDLIVKTLGNKRMPYAKSSPNISRVFGDGVEVRGLGPEDILIVEKHTKE